jgi:hypothetical protein
MILKSTTSVTKKNNFMQSRLSSTVDEAAQQNSFSGTPII